MTAALESADGAGAVRAAIVAERGDVGARVNLVRVAAVAGWLLLALGLGLGSRPEWLRPVPVLAVGLAIAVALQLTARRAAVRRLLWLAVPLLDLPVVAVAQSDLLSASTRPQAVAIFTIAIFASLIFVSQLSFAWRGIVLTLVGSIVAIAIVLWRAGLPPPNLLSAALLLAWAAGVAMFSSARISHLVATIARAQRERERELTELVATRTGELTQRNHELETALASLAKAQTDLVRAERMASVATLVKGIAHELNNPIGYIAGNVPHLQRYVRFLSEAALALGDGRARTPDELAAITRLDAKRDLAFVATDLAAVTSDIAEGSRRAKLIVGDLQSLTSGSSRAIEEVDLGRAIEQTRALFAARVEARVTLAIEAEQLPRMRARSGQLEQVLVNLVDNAIRAVGDGGDVHIKLARDHDLAVLTVRDTGCGMTDEQVARACEPFFTTRSAGEGSGLGLAIVASIVAAHGGQLAVTSQLGRGTTVTIQLPIHGLVDV
jgi:two-component system NtrC family sensor kinase